jgi:hypothetical protein
MLVRLEHLGEVVVWPQERHVQLRQPRLVRLRLRLRLRLRVEVRVRLRGASIFVSRARSE